MSREVQRIAKKSLLNPAMSATIDKQLGLNRTRSHAAVEKAIDAVMKEFRELSKDKAGLHALYNIINRSDPESTKHLLNDAKRPAALKNAHTELDKIIGSGSKNWLVKDLGKVANLTDSQSNDTLGFVTPVIFEAINSRLTDGTMEKNATSLSMLLNNTSKNPHQSTRHSASVNTNGASVATETSTPWLLRYAIPLFLLAALMIVTLRSCDVAENNRVITEERNQVEQKLANTQEQADLQTAEIASLKSSYGTAESEIEKLESDLQSSYNELAVLRDVPTDTAELQKQLAEVTDERQEALDNGSALAEQLEQTTLEREKIAQQSEALQLDLDNANQNIEENSKLINTLQTEVGSLTSARDTAAKNLDSTTQALELEKTSRQTDVDELTTKIQSLENQLAELTQGIDKRNEQIDLLSTEKIDLEAQLQEKDIELADAIANNESVVNRLNGDATNLKNQLAELVTARNTAETALKASDDKLAENSSIISALEEKITGLEQEKSDSIQSDKALKQQLSDLQADYSKSQDDLDDQTTAFADSQSTLEQTNISLETARGDISTLTSARTELLAVQDQLKVTIEKLKIEGTTAAENIEQGVQKNNALTAKLNSAEKENKSARSKITELEKTLSSKEGEIAQLSAKRDSLQAVLDDDAARSQALTEETLKLRDSIDQKLSQAGVKGVAVESIEGDRAVAMTLGSTTLFQVGDASLTREGGKVLSTISQLVIANPEWRMDVEGHTDSLPIGDSLRSRYPSNWELSSARASAVINYLRLTSEIPTESLSAKGFAETRPIADNSTVAGRVKNRRVDLILRR